MYMNGELDNKCSFSLFSYNRSWFQHTRAWMGRALRIRLTDERGRGSGHRTRDFWTSGCNSDFLQSQSYLGIPETWVPGAPGMPGCSSPLHKNTCKSPLRICRFPTSNKNHIYHPRLLESADAKPGLGKANLFGEKNLCSSRVNCTFLVFQYSSDMVMSKEWSSIFQKKKKVFQFFSAKILFIPKVQPLSLSFHQWGLFSFLWCRTGN